MQNSQFKGGTRQPLVPAERAISAEKPTPRFILAGGRVPPEARLAALLGCAFINSSNVAGAVLDVGICSAVI